MKASLSFPSTAYLSRFLKNKASESYSYAPVGGSKTEVVRGYDNDYNYRVIGEGAESWERARAALRDWEQFPSSWTRIAPPGAPLKAGEVVAVLFRIFGIWWINSARIVYTIDEPNRFGFAYGTLPGHLEQGEECFWVERSDEGEVTYHIRAFSKPYYWFVRLGYPLARYFQRRFVRQSMERMRNICKPSKKVIT